MTRARRRGLSLTELFASLALLLATLSVLTQLFNTGLQVRRHAEQVEQEQLDRGQLRARLTRALELGWAEGDEGKLVCRTRGGYRVFATRDGALFEVELRPGRAPRPARIVRHVQAARFTIARDDAGKPTGVAYEVRVQVPDLHAPTRLAGFVVARLERVPISSTPLQDLLPEGW